MNIPICDLCGQPSLDVRPGLAEFPEGYRQLRRCADHDACRERVLFAGDDWPLLDVTDATVVA